MSTITQLITDHLDTWTTAQTAKPRGRGKRSDKTQHHGIQKLRELILELAVLGKLVPQDASDESAAVLLERIAAEKARLVKENKIKKAKASPKNSEEAKPFNLPQGWEWAKLCDVGLVASSRRVHQKDWMKEGIPFFRAREIVKLSQHGSVDNELFISEELFTALSKSGVSPEAGDLMITGVGTIGIPYIVNHKDKFYFKDASVLIFKNYFDLSPEFLFYLLKSPYWLNTIYASSMGTTVHTLTIGRANEVAIPIPPLVEQRRIVTKVDELMALCDQLEQQQTQHQQTHQTLVTALLNSLVESATPTTSEGGAAEATATFFDQFIAQHFDTLFTTEQSIDQLKQTLLQLAVVGKLVPQDPNDEPASQLLEKIATEKAQLIKEKKIKKQKALPEIVKDETLFQLPEGWRWTRLGQVAVSGPTNGYSPKPAQIETEYRCLTLSATTQGVFKSECFKYVDIPEETAQKFYLKAGDLLIQRANSINYVGVSAIYNLDNDHFIYPDLMMRVQLSQEIDLRFVHLFLSSFFAREFFRNNATGTQGNMPKINQGTVNSAPLAVPPLAEQHRIVTKIDQLMTLCDQLKTCLQHAQTLQQHLADTIVEQVVN